MFRLLAIALLALALTPGVRPVDAAQDVRIDPRAVNIAPGDLPKAFSETTRLFSVNRYRPLYFGDYGRLSATIIYKTGAAPNGSFIVAGSISSYASAAATAAACCLNLGPGHWKNKSNAFQTQRIGDEGFSQQAGPDATGYITDTIVFRQRLSTVTLQFAYPTAVHGQSAAMKPDQLTRLAQTLNARIQAASAVPVANLLTELTQPQRPMRISRPTISNLGLNVDAGLDIAATAGASTLTLSAFAAPGASCTPSVTYAGGKAQPGVQRVARTISGSGTVSWSWRPTAAPVTGTATVYCGLDKLVGAAEISYLLMP